MKTPQEIFEEVGCSNPLLKTLFNCSLSLETTVKLFKKGNMNSITGRKFCRYTANFIKNETRRI